MLPNWEGSVSGIAAVGVAIGAVLVFAGGVMAGDGAGTGLALLPAGSAFAGATASPLAAANISGETTGLARPSATAFKSFCNVMGFSKKSTAPMRVASTAVSTVA